MKKVWNKYEKCNLLDQKFKICFLSNIHVSESMFYIRTLVSIKSLMKLIGALPNLPNSGPNPR